jgi:GNAT superfamily N-acetyltransferase
MGPELIRAVCRGGEKKVPTRVASAGNDLPGIIRVLTPADRQAFEDHLLRLDAASRRDRFNGVTDDGFVKTYSARCFTGKTVVFAYLEEGTVHAAAELHHLDGEARGEGEIAFSVERDFQHKGIGSLLFGHLVALARHLGYARLGVTTHSGNEAMKALARKFNAKLSFQQFETVGVIDISDAGRQGWTGNGVGLFGVLADLAQAARRRWHSDAGEDGDRSR